MSSPIPSKPLIGLEALKAFDQELNIVGASEDTDKVIGVMEKLLRESSLDLKPSSEISLVGRVKGIMGFLWGQTPSERALAKVQEMLVNPGLRAGADPRAIKALQKKMKEKLESKIECLKFGKILPGVSSISIQTLVSARRSGHTLPRAMVRSMIGMNINKGKELKEDLESDPKLEYDYICLIERCLLGSDAVYLEKDGERLPGRYRESAVKAWLQKKEYDPSGTGRKVTVANIKPDYEAMEFIEKKTLAWVDSKMGAVPTSSADVEELQSESLLRAIAIAYPIVQKEYERVLSEKQDVIAAIKEAEVFAEKAVGFLIEVNMDEVVPSYVPWVEDFIERAVKELKSGEDLETVNTSFKRSFPDFITLFHEIDSETLSPFFKKEALKRVGVKIGEGASLAEVREEFTKYKAEIEALRVQEQKVRKDYPDLIRGAEVWEEFFGKLEDVPPIPKELLDKVDQPFPGGGIYADKCVLGLVPNKVKGEILTLKSMGKFMKSHLTNSNSGYRVFNKNIKGDNPDPKPRWRLMTLDVLPDSRIESYDEQEKIVLELPGAEMPNAFDVIVLTYIEFLASGRYLLETGTYTRCSDKVDGYHVAVGACPCWGLCPVRPRRQRQRFRLRLRLRWRLCPVVVLAIGT